MVNMSTEKSQTQKTIVYIDGFNLYFGLKEKGWKKYYWLNLYSLAHKLLKPYQSLICVKYFTSRISLPPAKQKRQQIFLEALQTLPGIDMYFGKYVTDTVECNRCGNIIYKPNEKMTDVNIATEMLSDVNQDIVDCLILISADSDLSGPIRKIKNLCPEKRVIIAFPPNRFSYELAKLAHGYFTIGRKKIHDSVFPDEIEKTDGYVLKIPEEWQ